MSLRYESLAVIVCTRNRPEMLDRALTSILKHIPHEVEVLVVDSASASDETRIVTERHSVGYVRTDVPGLSIARNLGVDSTDRDFILFTDDDCVAAPGVARETLLGFCGELTTCVTGTMQDHGSPTPDLTHQSMTEFTHVRDGIDCGHGAAMAFRRSAVLRIGGFDENLGAGSDLPGAEDLDMFCRLLWAGTTIVKNPHLRIVHAKTRLGAEFKDLQYGYGLGLGAMIGKWTRISRPVAVMMFLRASRRIGRRFVQPANNSDDRPSTAAFGSGLLLGIWRSKAFELQGDVFVKRQGERPALVYDGQTS